MFEEESEEYANKYGQDAFTQAHMPHMIEPIRMERKLGFQKGAEFGYNYVIEWFSAKESIPINKKAEIYRYTLEVISDKGDIVCYDYKDKDWKKIVIEDEKVTYVPVEIEKWCNKPTKEIE